MPPKRPQDGGDYTFGSVKMDELNRGQSFRVGEAVYYNPANSGPYVDGEDALADVPTGGTFVIAAGAPYVPAVEGRLLLDRPINIRGEGTGRDANRANYGSVIDNYTNTIDEPVIEFTSSKHQHRPSIRSVRVQHQGAATPAIRIHNFVRSLIADCSIGCGSAAPTGVEYVGKAFFARMERTEVSAFTDVGVLVRGTGYAHEFHKNHVSTGIDGATCLETRRHRTFISGGEYASTGTGGTAIRFNNPEIDQSGPRYGGLVINPGIELTDTCVDINEGGSAKFHDVQLHHLFAMSAMGTVANFGNTRNSRLIRPIKLGNNVTMARWTANAGNAGVVAPVNDVKNVNWDVDAGALRPFVKIEGPANNRELSNISTPAGLHVVADYNPDVNSPVFFDGSEWYEQSSANSTFRP